MLDLNHVITFQVSAVPRARLTVTNLFSIALGDYFRVRNGSCGSCVGRIASRPICFR